MAMGSGWTTYRKTEIYHHAIRVEIREALRGARQDNTSNQLAPRRFNNPTPVDYRAGR
jgi:hypothetical protein